jgi:predicted transcriptional regulator
MIRTRIDTTAANLVRLLDALDLHTEDFAALAGIHRATAFRWIGAQAPVPVSVIRMLELMLEKKDKAA